MSTSTLETFLHGSDTQFGIFYPKDHIVAIFPGPSESFLAQRALRTAGFSDDEVLAVPGAEVVRYAEEHLKKEHLWGQLMSQISRFIGTEAIYADQDLELARKGASFLVVHVATDARKTAGWAALKPLNPLEARYYSAGGIEVLRGAGADHNRPADKVV